MRHYLFSLFIASFLLPFTVFAQAEASLSLTPENPVPNEDVVVTLVSYSFDVNVAMITWSVNGKTLLSGLGKKSITLPVGEVGQDIPLTVQATTADGSSVAQRITISPQSIDLIYESIESYVPPFYPGRSLAAEGSNVRIVALPTVAEFGKKVPDANLSYSWYVNDEYKSGSSGVGKSSFVIPLDYLSDSTYVRVLVRSPLGNTAEKSISVYPHKVMPLLYKYDSLLGVDLSRTFEKRLELSKEITLSLEPFFLSTRKMESTASYEWYLDGLPVTPEEKTFLSLRPKENSYGSRTLTLTVAQAKRKLQEAQNSLEVVFDTRK